MIKIVGGGLSGLTVARALAETGNDVEVYERLPQLGGNLSESWVNGTLIHDHGPHIFHTNSDRIWRWVTRFSDFSPYYHRVTGMVFGQLVPIPFNFRSIECCFPKKFSDKIISKLIEVFGFGARVSIFDLLNHSDEDLSFLGEFVYKNVFLGYSEKQWGTKAENINTSVLKRVPISISYDDRYFDDKFQGIPTNGYTELISNIANHPKIKLIKGHVNYGDIKQTGSVIVNTSPLDEFFDFRYGKLDYRTLTFKPVDLCTANIKIETAQTNFPNGELFTRITRYGIIGSQTQNFVYVAEYPADYDQNSGHHRYYPINTEANDEMARKYKSFARGEGVWLAGRLGEYRYFNMDQAIGNALNVADKVNREKL